MARAALVLVVLVLLLVSPAASIAFFNFSSTGAGVAATITFTYRATPPLIFNNDDRISLAFPSSYGGFRFNTGGMTEILPRVATYPGNPFNPLPLQGTGAPTLSIEGSTLSIQLGGAGAPTASDSQLAGLVFDLTYARNPNGLFPAGLTANLTLVNQTGGVREQLSLALPAFSVNTLDSSRCSVQLSTPTAGVQTDLIVVLTTASWIPHGGSLVITLPAGFSLATGDPVVQRATDMGPNSTLLLTGLDPLAPSITLGVAPLLGMPPAPIAPLASASFRVTDVGTTWAGLSGNVTLATYSDAGDPIDLGSIPGVLLAPGRISDLSLTPASDGARETTTYSLTLTTPVTLPADGWLFLDFPYGYLLLDSLTLLSTNGLGSVGGVVNVTRTGLTVGLRLGGPGPIPGLEPSPLSLSLSGIVNPAAGSTGAFNLRATGRDPAWLVAAGSSPGPAIQSGRFPYSAAAVSATLAGGPTALTVALTAARTVVLATALTRLKLNSRLTRLCATLLVVP